MYNIYTQTIYKVKIECQEQNFVNDNVCNVPYILIKNSVSKHNPVKMYKNSCVQYDAQYLLYS